MPLSILSLLLVLLAACSGPYVSGKHREGASLLAEQQYDAAIGMLQEARDEAERGSDPRGTVAVSDTLAWAYAEGMRFDEAERTMQAAIALAERDRLDPALLHARLSVIQSKSGNYRQGIQSAGRALDLVVSRWTVRAGSEDREAVLDYAMAHHGWPPDVDMLKTVTMAESAAAVSHLLLGEERPALRIGEQALRHFEAMSFLMTMAPSSEKPEFYRGKGVAAAAVSRAARNLGDQAREQAALQIAKEAFRQAGRPVQGDDLLAAYAASGRYAAGAVMTAGGFKPDSRYSPAFNEADRLYFDGDYAAAIPAFEAVIAAGKTAGRTEEASRASSQLGWLMAELGRYAEAIRLLRDSARLAPQQDEAAVTYARLSAVEARLGHYDRGLEDADRALTTLYERRKVLFRGRDREAVIDEAMKHPGLPPDILLMKGVTAAEGGRTTNHYFRGDFAATVREGERAIGHFHDITAAVLLAPEREQISFAEGLGWVTLMTGDAYVNLGQIAKGRTLIQQSRQAFQRARQNYGDVIAEGLTAYSYVLEGDARKAAELLKGTLARVEAGGLEELKWHIRARLAEQLLEEARRLDNQAVSAVAAASAGGTTATQAVPTGLTAKTEALRLLLDDATSARLVRMLDAMQRAADSGAAASQMAALSRLFKEEAYRNLLGAADNLDSIRSRLETDLNKRLFQANKQRIYGELIQLATDLYGAEQGFQALERAKARGLMDLLATKELRFKQDAALQEERDLRASAGTLLVQESRAAQGMAPPPAGGSAATRTAMRQLTERYRGILLKIKREEPELASFISPPPLTYDSLRASLPPDVTLLEYFAGEDRLYIWILDSQSIAVRTVPVTKPALTARIRQFREAITARDRAAQTGQARALYELLVAPAKPAIRGTRLGIVPHDSLHYLPFQALSAGDRYLIQDYPLFYAPSSAVLQYALAKRRPRGQRLLAFGNPDLGNPELDLPFAQTEVEALGRLYPAPTIHLRETATERAAKSESGAYDLLHFASHAEFSEMDPLYSGLRLAADRERREDGRLAASEIFALDLKSDLVTLSACQTGLGVATSGDEVIGMTRALIYAGAPSIVASHWSVSDLSTARLMEAFYRNLKTMPKDEALQAAELDLLNTEAFGDPFYWAAFYLTGDWR